MKIVVSVKRVPDPYGRLALTPDGEIDFSSTDWVINPFDEIALEEAARLRDRLGELEIVAVTVGPLDCEQQLRRALAMGADRATHIIDDVPLDHGVIASLLACLCREERPDIVLMGKQATDDDCGQVGPRLAAELEMPQATFASQIEVNVPQNTVTVTREVDSGRETVLLSMPCVITADLRLNEPRYIALPAIIRARNKPIHTVVASTLGQFPVPRLHTVRLDTVTSRKQVRYVNSVHELIAALRDEAGVL